MEILLAVTDSLTTATPDSALRLIQKHENDMFHWSKSQRMRCELLRARAMNKTYTKSPPTM